MRRPVVFAVLLMLSPAAARARADAPGSGADCSLFAALAAPRGAGLGAGRVVPRAMTVRPGAGRLHFAKDGAVQPGCPSDAAACLSAGYVVAGDPVVAVATHAGYACAIFTGPPPRAATTGGWLPASALVPMPDAGGHDAAGAAWTGNWISGPEKAIAIRRAPDGSLAMHGAATFGAGDPERVKRGGVNTGAFDVTAAASGTQLAFLVGDDGAALPFDAGNATSCGLRLWRLGPYLVAADNLQCGGNGVTFTGVYRRSGNPS